MIRFLLLLLAVNASAAILEWDRNLETNVAGYRLWWGGQSRAYTNVLTTTNTTAIVSNSMMAPGTNFFAVTAFDTDGLESDYSDEVSTSRRPLAPIRLRITNQIVLQQSTNLFDWTSIATNSIATGSSASFFRAAAQVETAPATSKRLTSTVGKKGKLQ